MEEDDFDFSVDCAGAPFRLGFSGHTERAQAFLERVWKPMTLALTSFHALLGSNPPGWVHWQIQRWCSRPDGSRQVYCAWFGEDLAAVLNLWPGLPSQESNEKRLMYVEHMIVSPWHQDTALWKRKGLSNVGAALLAYAVFQSRKQGFEGAIGLHASDDVARDYYRWLNKTYDNSLFCDERQNVVGPGVGERAASFQTRTYFETTATGAANLLGDYRRA